MSHGGFFLTKKCCFIYYLKRYLRPALLHRMGRGGTWLHQWGKVCWTAINLPKTSPLYTTENEHDWLENPPWMSRCIFLLKMEMFQCYSLVFRGVTNHWIKWAKSEVWSCFFSWLNRFCVPSLKRTASLHPKMESWNTTVDGWNLANQLRLVVLSYYIFIGF